MQSRVVHGKDFDLYSKVAGRLQVLSRGVACHTAEEECILRDCGGSPSEIEQWPGQGQCDGRENGKN